LPALEAVYHLDVEVVEIKGHCPVYAVGDRFAILEGYKLRAEKPLYPHSLASTFPYYVALSRGVSPSELGLGQEDAAYVQCLDPCERTGGGTVVFRIRRLEHDRVTEEGRAKAE
jgi:uncharacterized repeat protein (TIGR04076 family)